MVAISTRIQASSEHAAAAYALLEESGEWLRKNGIPQWQRPYPRQRFEREVEAGAVWFWRDASGFAATVTLHTARLPYYPEQIWRDETAAWYVCRFAVARRLQGRSVGSQLLDELTVDAVALQLAALRLDVVASNPRLARYYEANGFARVGEGDIQGASSIFFEKRAAPG